MSKAAKGADGNGLQVNNTELGQPAARQWWLHVIVSPEQLSRSEVKEKLTKPQLLQLLDRVFRARTYGLSQEERDEAFLLFCAGCPDPIQAWRLITDCMDPMTDDELVDRALAMATRLMTDVPDSEFSARHPLRSLAL